MATSEPSEKWSGQFIDMPHCTICLETYKEPKVLQCGHTFCLSCLEQCGQDDEPGDSCLKCPQCRTFFDIPLGGIQELPNNYAILQLTPATSVFYDYDLRNYEQDPLSGPESLPRLESPPRPESPPRMNSPPRLESLPEFCRYHPSKQTKFYCHDCKIITCIICFKERHHWHRWSGIEEAFAEFSEQLKKDIRTVMPYAETGRDELKVIEEHEKVLASKAKKAKEDVSDKCGQLRSILEANLNELLNELDLFQTKMLRELDRRREKVEAQILSVDRFKKRYEEIVADNGPFCQIDLAAKVPDLHMIATDLTKTQEKFMETQLTPPLIQFVQVEEIYNWIGHFDYQGILHETQSRNLSNQMNSNTQPLNQSQNSNISIENSTIQPFYERINSPNQLNSATQPSNLIYASLSLQKSLAVRIIYDRDNTGMITGIAALKKRLFVVRDEITHVKVYNVDNLAAAPVQLEISPIALRYPRVAACPQKNCLFVSALIQAQSSIIYRMNLLNNSVNEWRVSGDCSGLSVTIDNNLLITLATQGRVQEYTEDGQLIRELDLDRRLHVPHQCVQMSDGNFVVSHSGPRQKQLSIVDTSGEVLHSYRRCQRPAHIIASRTQQLVVDRYNHVFVVDSNIDRIQVLSSTLAHICYVQSSWYTINQACSIEFDEIKGLLYVGEVSGRLLVFSA